MSTTWTEFRVVRRNGEWVGDYPTAEDAMTTMRLIEREHPPFEREPLLRRRTVQASNWEPVFAPVDP